MKTKLTAALIATASLTLVACGSPKPLYDDASKMNRLEIGMDVNQVQGLLGNPRTSLANSYGFRCAEYALLKHSANFRQTYPDTFYVMLFKGRVVDMGEHRCSGEMSESNFRQDKSYPGKYARFIGQ